MLEGQAAGTTTRKRMSKAQIQLRLSRFADMRFVSVLLAIIATIMVFGGLFSAISDAILPVNADTTRPSVFIYLQTIDQILGFPLPVNEMANTSITSLGIATSVIGLDLLVISQGLRTKNRLALWIAIVVLLLATYFDVVSFLFHGLLGAPMSALGATVNGLMFYALVKSRRLFRQ